MVAGKSELTPFLFAIETSKNLEEFLPKIAKLLTAYCKKIQVIWQEPGNQKIKKIEKIGRNKFNHTELQTFDIKEDQGYKVINIPTDDEISSKGGRFLLKVKTKSQLSQKKFSSVINLISFGINTIYQKQKAHHKIEMMEEEKKEILTRSEILENLCFLKQQEYEAMAKSIFEIIIKNLQSAENISIFIPEKINLTLKENYEFQEEIERIWEALISSSEPTPKNGIYYFKISGKDPISPAGIIVIKAPQIGENERKILEFLTKYLEMYIRMSYEKESLELERFFALFGNMEIPIAVFKKNSDLPMFKNSKFEEYLLRYPELQNIVKEDVAFSINFVISSMREVTIEGKTFIIFSNNLKETYILVQIIEASKHTTEQKEYSQITNYPDISSVESKIEEIEDSIENIIKKTHRKKIREELNSVINIIRKIQNEVKLASIKKEVPKKIDIAELITKVLASIKTPSKMKIRINKKGDTISMIEEELTKIVLTDILIKTVENKEDSITKLTIDILGDKEDVIVQLRNSFSDRFISNIKENTEKYSLLTPIKINTEGSKVVIKFPKM